MSNFTYKGAKFYLNGEPFQVRSGAMHYFRIPSIYWEDRLLKLKECGFNTVETYIAWNVHEENEGEFRFDGEKDFGKFLDIANKLGLYAIVRPGPYICAEWEMGGFPAWLLKYPNIKLRCNNPIYLEKVEKYIENIAPIIRPRLCKNGGNVLMMQVENEYGSYGNDKGYLNKIKEMYINNGLDCLLFTGDGASVNSVRNGSVDGCLPMLTFGSRTEQSMEMLRSYAGDIPLMCVEFWDGWFDHWYEEHHVRSVESICQEFEPFLKHDYNFNFYMFHGGTNFGFMNGANFTVADEGRFCDGIYKPTVTSYDYNALLTEAGDRTPAYYAVRELIKQYTGVEIPLTARETEKRSYGKVTFTQSADLFENIENIGKTTSHVTPISMEESGQNYGYMVYSTTVWQNTNSIFRIIDLADRANVFVNGKPVAVLERSRDSETVRVQTGDKPERMDILVENMGRINYGSYVEDRKGLKGVKFWEVQPFYWDITNLPMDNLSLLNFKKIDGEFSKLPTFYKTQFTVDKIADTFVKPTGFSKGFIVINGFNLGRYYNAAGPQKTLYVPKSCLKEGGNEIIVFDSDGATEAFVEFFDKPQLG